MHRDEQSRKRSSSGDVSLQRSLALEHLLADLAANLVDLPRESGIDNVNRTFHTLAKYFNVSQVALWEFLANRDEYVVLHDADGAVATGVRPSAQNFHWAKKSLSLGNAIYIFVPNDIPAEATELAAKFKKQTIKSWVALPLRKSGLVFGALVFVSSRHALNQDVRVRRQLETVANILASTLARIRAEETLRQSPLLGETILGTMQDDVALLDRNGVIIAASKRWREAVNQGGNDLLNEAQVGANYLDLCRKIGTDQSIRALNAINSALSRPARSVDFEFRCESPAQKTWHRMTVTPLTRFEGGALITYRDLTRQKRLEAELRESENRFHKIADEVPIMMWIHNPDKQLTYTNQAILDFSGVKPRDLLGRKWLALIHPEDRARLWNAYEKAVRQRKKFSLECLHLHASGRYRWLSVNGSPRYVDGAFSGYTGVYVDIHAHKEAENGRSQFAGMLLRAQEEERSRIGRELHDDFAQRLALLTIQLQEVGRASLDFTTAARIAEIKKQTDRLSKDIAHLSHRLHSSYLDNFGLPVAVKNLCKEISRMHHFEINCEVGRVPPVLDKRIVLTFFPVLQEALHNVVKHSQATKVRATLFSDGTEIVLRVTDNGVGFNPHFSVPPKGLGLTSMKERLHLAGGTLSVVSKPMIGTQIEARMPLEDATEENVESITDHRRTMAG